MKTDDPAFRHIWKMMAADLALLLAEWLVPLTVFIIVLYGDEAVSRTVMIESDLDLYLLWTVRCLRLLTWLGMIVHLERLEGGFRSAKRWYLLRIFVFLTVQVLSGIQSQSPLLVGVGNRSLFSIITVVFSTLIIPPLLPMGNRALLKAGADLLRYYGMEKPARAESCWPCFPGRLTDVCCYLIRSLSSFFSPANTLCFRIWSRRTAPS